MDLGLGGRGYLLTGASRGLGFATARALVDDGARVLISSRSRRSVNAAVAELGGAPAAHGLAADLADPEAAQHLTFAARTELQRVDGLLISVGGPAPGTVLEMGEEHWRTAFESVLLGRCGWSRRWCRTWGEGAAIGFVLSTSVREPIRQLAISNGLRPGLAMTAKALADELGPAASGSSGSCPGTIATDRIAEIEAASGDADGRARRTGRGHPAAPGGRPEEFGRVAAFALSPAASYSDRHDDRRRRRRHSGRCDAPPPSAGVLVACAHGTRNPTGRRLIAELALAARSLRPGLATTAAFVDVQPPTVVDVVAGLSGRGAGGGRRAAAAVRRLPRARRHRPGRGGRRRAPSRPARSVPTPAGRGAARPAGAGRRRSPGSAHRRRPRRRRAPATCGRWPTSRAPPTCSSAPGRGR